MDDDDDDVLPVEHIEEHLAGDLVEHIFNMALYRQQANDKAAPLRVIKVVFDELVQQLMDLGYDADSLHKAIEGAQQRPIV